MEQFFKKVTNKIKGYDSIYIMTHKNMDLDGFGAALGLSNIIKKYEKKANIIIADDIKEESIQKAIEFLHSKNYDLLKASEIRNISKESLLIILDVHKKEMLEVPELVDKVKEIILVDHHIQKDPIVSNLNLLEPSVSSTVEIIVNYLLQEKIQIDSITSTIMLAGIYIDTNGFNIKTTDKTFEAAAYLMKNKADNVLKQSLFQENKNEIIHRKELLKNSHKINNNMVICTLDKKIYKTSDLAKIAEEILQFENIEASFTIGYLDEKTVGISARSLGKIDVEKIMNSLGGGGHKTDAACRIENSSITKVKDKLECLLR